MSERNTTSQTLSEAAKPTCNATYIRSEAMDPDVVVVVGGQEFREFSQALCCWSGYFDSAFHSGMKEATTKRFEFPDEDPAEWEWIVSLMAPLATQKITSDNVLRALHWFDLLCVDRGLAACDALLKQKVGLSSGRYLPLNVLETSIRYNLPASKVVSCKRIVSMINGKGARPDDMKRVIEFMRIDQDCYEAFCGCLEKYMPGHYRKGEDLPESVTIPLHMFLHLKIKAEPTGRTPGKKIGGRLASSFYERGALVTVIF